MVSVIPKNLLKNLNVKTYFYKKEEKLRLKISDFAKMIEFSLVRPDATDKDIEKFCRIVRENNFATACVNPVNVALTSKLLKGTGIDISASIGLSLPDLERNKLYSKLYSEVYSKFYDRVHDLIRIASSIVE